MDEINQSKKVGKTAQEEALAKAEAFVASHTAAKDLQKTEAEQQADQSRFLPATESNGQNNVFTEKQVPQQEDKGVSGMVGAGDIGNNLMKTPEQVEAEKAKKNVSS